MGGHTRNWTVPLAVQGVFPIERSMPDSLHHKTGTVTNLINYLHKFNYTLRKPDGSPRTLGELRHLQGLTDKLRDASKGYDLKTHLLRAANEPEWPVCGIHGNLVRSK